VAFGLIPLRQLLRRSYGDALSGGSRKTESASTWRVRAVLVSVNVAMAVLLLIGSGLLVRSLGGLLSQSPGLDPTGVLTLQVWATGDRFRAGENADQVATAVRFYDEVLTRARALPGVTAAAGVTTLPLGGGVDGYGFHIQGRPTANPEAAPSADRFVVTPDYFAATRIPLSRGRLLNAQDSQGSEPVVVINTTTAQTLFKGEDPVGQRVSLGPPTAQPRTIVGVVGDVRHHGLHEVVGYQVYVPQAQWVWAETYMTLLIRTGGDPALLAGPMRDVMRAVDPAQPVSNVEPYEQIVAASTGTRRFATGLLSAFAATALMMAIIGLYGAVGVTVGQRQREMGLRMALGARAADIRRMVLAQGLRPVAFGLVAGLALALLSVDTLHSMLYEIAALDPLTFGLATVTLAVCAVTACLGPAWRASRVDPAVTLRG
jgi:predicted permease